MFLRAALRNRAVLIRMLLVSSLATCFCSSAGGQQPPATETLIWPEIDAHIELPSDLRVLAFTGQGQAVDYPYQQWYAAVGIGYQFKPFLRDHLLNIDPDKEHFLVFGVGYEYLQTIQSGKVKDENRGVIELTPGFLLPGTVLMRDRNRLELRWIDGTYSTTYRNEFSVEREFITHGIRFSPFASAEVFYDSSKHSWNEEWYTAGLLWPYKSFFMLETYYRRENCVTCNPAYWNVGGVTFNFYFDKSR
jgi:hypothetical protein